MEISLRKMRLFLAIISEGSFSKAAQKMSITQPAASIIINQVEDMLQVQLFQKKKY